ncbi:MAG: plastocyanin [Haloarculaceae archaeon]|jgi:plastocyanin
MPVTRRRLIQITVAGSLSLAGCTGDGGDGDGGGQAADSSPASGVADNTISMQDTTFQPRKATVDVGTTVEWTNNDGVGHTVTSAQFHDKAASWNLDSEASGGDTITHTFEAEGVYEYYCTIHGRERMCGAVLVGGATLDASLPCGDAGGAGGAGGGY